jgi:hypothetical protein
VQTGLVNFEVIAVSSCTNLAQRVPETRRCGTPSNM